MFRNPHAVAIAAVHYINDGSCFRIVVEPAAGVRNTGEGGGMAPSGVLR